MQRQHTQKKQKLIAPRIGQLLIDVNMRCSCQRHVKRSDTCQTPNEKNEILRPSPQKQSTHSCRSAMLGRSRIRCHAPDSLKKAQVQSQNESKQYAVCAQHAGPSPKPESPVGTACTLGKRRHIHTTQQYLSLVMRFAIQWWSKSETNQACTISHHDP